MTKSCRVKIVVTIDNNSTQSMLQVMPFLPAAHTVCDVGLVDGLRVLLAFNFQFQPLFKYLALHSGSHLIFETPGCLCNSVCSKKVSFPVLQEANCVQNCVQKVVLNRSVLQWEELLIVSRIPHEFILDLSL